MLTPEQIEALRDRAGQISDPINDFLLGDIARRVSGAGQLTSSAAYQVWRAQQLGLSQKEVKKRLRELLGKSQKEINELLTQAAEVGYRFDLDRLPTAAAIPFAENAVMQQLVSAAVKLAQDGFTNLTQTLGMVDPFGSVLPLRDAYRKCMDYAFEQVFTGATDYNTAIRRATKNLADMGVRVIDYESGVHTGLEAAVRRNIMGGLGLMQEQIAQQNYDDLGCDGWEISAHAASAPDHEPIQGKQYSDARYKALNGSLKRRIGTLNCGHAAFPIILGVNSPQYTAKQLREFREDNEAGVTYEGRHYTMYEATQQQRKVERSIRRQKSRILVDEAAGDAEKLTTDRIRLQRLNQEYARFSKATGLPTQRERTMVAGFGRGGHRSAGASDFGRGAAPVKKDATFKTAIPGYSDAVNDSISRAGKHTVEEGAKRQGEHLVLVDTRTGEWVFEEAGDEVSVGSSEAFRRFVEEHPDGRFSYVHSHPSGKGFSLNDMVEFFGADQFESMVAAGYNGKVYAVYGKHGQVNVWGTLMKPEVDTALTGDLRQQLRDGTIDSSYFKREVERRRVQYLKDHFCSEWEAGT